LDDCRKGWNSLNVHFEESASDGGAIELSHLDGMAATRHLVLLDVSRQMLNVEQRLQHCDPECDRALMEIRRLVIWVASRVERNEGVAGAQG
jgi:hypothetical protein